MSLALYSLILLLVLLINLFVFKIFAYFHILFFFSVYGTFVPYECNVGFTGDGVPVGPTLVNYRCTAEGKLMPGFCCMENFRK